MKYEVRREEGESEREGRRRVLRAQDEGDEENKGFGRDNRVIFTGDLGGDFAREKEQILPRHLFTFSLSFVLRRQMEREPRTPTFSPSRFHRDPANERGRVNIFRGFFFLFDNGKRKKIKYDKESKIFTALSLNITRMWFSVSLSFMKYERRAISM